MVVDDSAFMRNLLKKQIISNGAEIIAEAENGQEAIDKYFTIKPDLVFMDIMMPVMNGLDALKGIMSKDSSAKIVICTSVGQDKIVSDAVEAGASDFIVKPFNESDVSSVVKKYIT
jgi:two-component system chemotaxis response regulator CheY